MAPPTMNAHLHHRLWPLVALMLRFLSLLSYCLSASESRAHDLLERLVEHVAHEVGVVRQMRRDDVQHEHMRMHQSAHELQLERLPAEVSAGRARHDVPLLRSAVGDEREPVLRARRAAHVSARDAWARARAGARARRRARRLGARARARLGVKSRLEVGTNQN